MLQTHESHKGNGLRQGQKASAVSDDGLVSRFSKGEWSNYGSDTYHLFEGIPSGKHTLEVRARDRDFNVDPTPAVVRFSVTK